MRAPDFLTGGGEMGVLMRAHDWPATSLGRPEAWPQPLKTLASVMLGSNQPMFVAWGSERVFLYNDAYSEILASKHPAALGRDFLDVWHEIRVDLEPIVSQAYAGEPVHMDDIELMIERKGYTEETHFAFSYTPVRNEAGEVAGFFCPCVEITEQVLSQRRRAADAERQRRLFEQAPGFITILSGPELRFEFVNEAYKRLFGRRCFVGKTVREAFPDLEGQPFFDLLDNAYATGERFIAKAMPIRLQAMSQAEPTDHFLDFIYEPIRDEAGHVTGLFIDGYDVTDAHAAQKALRESMERQCFLVALGDRTRELADPALIIAAATALLGEHLGVAQIGFGEVDEAQEYVAVRRDWNDGRVASVVGSWRLDDFGPAFATDLKAGATVVISDVAEDARTSAPEVTAAYAAIGARAIVDIPLIKDGRMVALLFVHHPEPRAWTPDELALAEEVCDRLWGAVEYARAEAALRESEARFRLMADAVPQIVWITDRHGRMEFLNRQFVNYTGALGEAWTAREMAANFMHPDDGAGVVAAFDTALRTGEPFEMEHRLRSAAGEDRWFLARAEPYRGPRTDEIVRWFGVSVDIHDRRRAEIALRESAARLRAVVDAAPVGLVFADASGRVTGANAQHDEILGRPVVHSDTIEDYGDDYVAFHADGRRVESHEYPIARVLRGEAERAELEVQVQLPKGSLRWVRYIGTPMRDEHGRIIGAVAASIDISREKRFAEDLAREVDIAVAEREQAQEQLRQSQKLEAMGQLTGGVAHDVNNLLTPIMGSLDLLSRRGFGGAREQRMIDGALQSAERAKVLVQRLLAFARRQPLQSVPVDVGALVAGMADLVASTSGPRVRVELDIAADLQAALADPNQLEMAVLNLAVNARDAMAEGGTLTIAAQPATVGTSERSTLQPGQYVRLSVADTGIGMDEATCKRAVEPFYSTKGIGKGTGLGLSMVHGLVAQLGGALNIHSKPGLGTRVELWLPVSPESAQVPDRSARDDAQQATGTALLVDDEELVRVSAADMLADLGYTVVEAGSAEEALRLVEGGLRCDLLITDHLMAGMTGIQLAHQVRARWPDTPVLVVSGYAEVEGIAPDMPRLTKPFRRDDLAASLAALTARK